jgi:hypothetical protein
MTMHKRKMKSKGTKGGSMAKGALKKGGAGAVPKMGGPSPAPPKGAAGKLGDGAGTKLGGNRARSRDKRLQNAQL